MEREKIYRNDEMRCVDKLGKKQNNRPTYLYLFSISFFPMEFFFTVKVSINTPQKVSIPELS